jgi:hypothetical protein
MRRCLSRIAHSEPTVAMRGRLVCEGHRPRTGTQLRRYGPNFAKWGIQGPSPQPPVSRSDLVQWHIAAESSSWRLIGTRLFGLGRAGAEAALESRDKLGSISKQGDGADGPRRRDGHHKMSGFDCPVCNIPRLSPGDVTPSCIYCILWRRPSWSGGRGCGCSPPTT